MLELCANEITDLTELCLDPPQLVHLGLGFNQISHIDDYLTARYWSVLWNSIRISLPVISIMIGMN